MKTCSKCKQTKPKTDFYLDSKRGDGYRPWCKACIMEGSIHYIRHDRDGVKVCGGDTIEIYPGSQRAWRGNVIRFENEWAIEKLGSGDIYPLGLFFDRDIKLIPPSESE